MPAGSIRSEGKAKTVAVDVISDSFADQLKHGMKGALMRAGNSYNDRDVPFIPAIVYKRGESAVTVDLLKGHNLLHKYVNGVFFRVSPPLQQQIPSVLLQSFP